MDTGTPDGKHTWRGPLVRFLVVTAIMLPDFTFAESVDTPMGDVFCTVAVWVSSNTGKGLATLAISITGSGALLGKVAWSAVILVGIGVAVIFGAAAVVDGLNPRAATVTCDPIIIITGRAPSRS